MKLVTYIDVVFKLKFTNGKSPMLPALFHLVLFSFFAFMATNGGKKTKWFVSENTWWLHWFFAGLWLLVELESIRYSFAEKKR